MDKTQGIHRGILALGVTAGLLAGCTTTRIERVPDRDCPPQPPLVYGALDVSDSARGEAVLAERLASVEEVLTETAICGGRARVVAFTASSAATQTLLDRDLKPDGATRRAQLRRVPKLVDESMAEIRAALPAAAERLPGGGTDVLAQLRLANEFRGAMDAAGRPLRIVVWTDGVASSPPELNSASLDAGMAESLANAWPAEDLMGSEVTFAGIGRTAGALPPTPYVDALKAYYLRACERAHASCTVMS